MKAFCSHLRWNNEFLTWDPALHCGIRNMYITRGKLWQPDLYIYEMIETEDKGQKNPFFIIKYNGDTTDIRSTRIVGACKINIFKFPFDIQVCNISFGSFIYSGAEIKMKPLSNSTVVYETSKEYFVSKGDWILTNITVSLAEYNMGDAGYSKVYYTFTIQRVSTVYVLTFILPVYFMVILDMISMFIQMSKADRLGFKISLVLGFSVLLLILNDILPLSETPPLLGVFCCVCMATMVFSIFGSIGASYILNLYKAEGNTPRWVKSILLNRLSSLLCFKRTFLVDVGSMEALENSAFHKKSEINLDLVEKEVDTGEQLEIAIKVELIKSLLLAVRNIHKSLIDAQKTNIAKLQCSMAAKVVDRLILTVYMLIITALSIYVIVAWATTES